ncbi:MAG: ankyrin repeat domain-containing protein [Armatimonadota bacterium]
MNMKCLLGWHAWTGGRCSVCGIVDVERADRVFRMLWLAVEKGDTLAVRALIAVGADIEAKRHGVTALLHAASGGHVGCVRALLAARADVSPRDENVSTALSRAAVEGHAACVNALLAAGADANATDEWGSTALKMAAREGHTDCVNALLAAGADVNARDNSGSTVLKMAASEGHTDCVNALIAARADVNARDSIGSTALCWAAYKGRTDCVKALLAAGADVHAKTIVMSDIYENFDYVTALIAAGANVRFYESSADKANLIGKTVVAAPSSLVEPYRSESEAERSFFCVSRDKYGGYEGFWLADGLKGTTTSFLIERILTETPAWAITKYPRIASIAR